MGRFWEKVVSPRVDWRGNPISMVKALILANLIAFIPSTLFAAWTMKWLGLSWNGITSLLVWQPLTFLFVHVAPSEFPHSAA
jgi:hypothetical protein